MKKRDLAIILSLCSTLLINTAGISLSEAKGTINRNDIEINYERLAKIQAEQEKPKSAIENVQDGHLYIPKKTQLKVELVNSITSKTA